MTDSNMQPPTWLTSIVQDYYHDDFVWAPYVCRYNIDKGFITNCGQIGEGVTVYLPPAPVLKCMLTGSLGAPCDFPYSADDLRVLNNQAPAVQECTKTLAKTAWKSDQAGRSIYAGLYMYMTRAVMFEKKFGADSSQFRKACREPVKPQGDLFSSSSSLQLMDSVSLGVDGKPVITGHIGEFNSLGSCTDGQGNLVGNCAH